MGTNTRAVPAIRDRVGFWLTVHDATVQLRELGISELAECCGLAEQNAHDAVVVIHALAHRHLEELEAAVPDGCAGGDGDVTVIAVEYATPDGWVR
ncbi:MAG: hypothetical protein ACREM3_29720 [Candidatus Rokuibacteriota bacterium]